MRTMEANRLPRENKESNLPDTDVFLPLLRLDVGRETTLSEAGAEGAEETA